MQLSFRPTVVSKITELHSKCKSRLVELVNGRTVAVTLDIWTDRVMRGFIAITAHYLHDTTLQSALLICQHFKGTLFSLCMC